MNRTAIKEETVCMATEGRAIAIAMQNDAFRKAVFTGAAQAGEMVVSADVHELAEDTRSALFDAVATFTAFTGDYDPFGEHNFFAVEIGGETYFAKISYFADASMKERSADPGDPAQTYRVLAIMHASDEMTFIHPTNLHLTGAQADHFANGQTARMTRDYSTDGAWWIEADNGVDPRTKPFRFKSQSDALVGMARIARLRPDIPVEITPPKDPLDD